MLRACFEAKTRKKILKLILKKQVIPFENTYGFANIREQCLDPRRLYSGQSLYCSGPKLLVAGTAGDRSLTQTFPKTKKTGIILQGVR